MRSINLTQRLPMILLLCAFMTVRQTTYGNICYRAANPVNYNALTDTVPGECSKTFEIEKIIAEAISLGAPIYNQGLHLACYRIYEWAGYKILYEYGKNCKDVEKILKTAIEKSHGDFSDTEKAWLMRVAFDRVLGVPTETTPAEKPNSTRG